LRAFCGWADDGDPAQDGVSREKVGNAFYQGFFRSDYHHPDGFSATEFADGFEIQRGKIDIDTATCRAGITGGDIQSRAMRALGEFPCQCMFPPAGA